MTNGIRESVIFCCIGIAAVVGWYHFYVAPRDAILTDVMVCMDGDRSYEAYDTCVDSLKN